MPTTTTTRTRRETAAARRPARAEAAAPSEGASSTRTPHFAEGEGAGDAFDHAPRRPRAVDEAPRIETPRVLRGGMGVVGARLWTPPERAPRLGPVNILDVRPAVHGGDFALKRIQGDRLEVAADILKEGHDVMRARVVYGAPGEPREAWSRSVEMTYDYDADEWRAEIPLDRLGEYGYAIEAWTDRYGTFCDGLSRKAKAGRDVKSELLEGAALLKEAARGIRGSDRRVLLDAAKLLEDEQIPQSTRVARGLSDDVVSLMRKHERPFDLTTSSRDYRVKVERERAQFGAWYEFFPRSAGEVPGKHGTLEDAIRRLPLVREMGFDVVYLPPIHPIGEQARKGKNNAEVGQPGDVGSPWAIGSRHGGHKDIHPELGTMKDFERFVQEARKQGMEVAMDFAVQCAPDHPWVTEHPDWFKRRPDGTIQYGENPPKVYQDIVQLDLWGEKREEMWAEVRDTLLHWIDKGVKIFRVDNPHTKPPAMWEQVIHEIHEKHPDVVFLSEAFARPKKQDMFTKLGFSQTYTYFTWKNSRFELEQFMRDVVEKADSSRPNFFANTPDILPKYLQEGGRAHFQLRYALAATLSPSCGIYQGFELCENKALKGEEYLDSEKYEVKVRDWKAPGNIRDFIAQVNEIRNSNEAFRELTNLAIHNPDNPNVMAFSKVSRDEKNKVLVVANLDPHRTHEATVHLDGGKLGLDHGSRYVVHDLLTGEKYPWQGLSNYVKLDPEKAPLHIFRIEEV